MTTDQRDPCPTCSFPIRETVGMVCQTCGTDYGRGGAVTFSPSPDRGVTTDRAAELLRQHEWSDADPYKCQAEGCDWTGKRYYHYDHQADTLAAAGVLAHPDDGLRDALRATVSDWQERACRGGAYAACQRVVVADFAALLAEDGTR